jgi:hypothetical protein
MSNYTKKIMVKAVTGKEKGAEVNMNCTRTRVEMQWLCGWGCSSSGWPLPTPTARTTSCSRFSFKTGGPRAATSSNRYGCVSETRRRSTPKTSTFPSSYSTSGLFPGKVAWSMPVNNPARTAMCSSTLGAVARRRRSIRNSLRAWRVWAITPNLGSMESSQYTVWIWQWWWYWCGPSQQNRSCQGELSLCGIWSRVCVRCSCWGSISSSPRTTTCSSTRRGRRCPRRQTPTSIPRFDLIGMNKRMFY